MKVLETMSDMVGKKIVYQYTNSDEDIIMLVTSDDEIMFIKSFLGFMESSFKILDFYDSKNLIFENEYLSDRLKDFKPELIEDMSDEISEMKKKEKEKEDYALYQSLKERFES